MSDHSSLPWERCGAAGGDCVCGQIWSGPDDRVVAWVAVEGCPVQDHGDLSARRPTAAANAELIVRAVNCHADLLAACKMWDEGFVDGEQFDDRQFLEWVNKNRRAARTAIAKAEGKE